MYRVSDPVSLLQGSLCYSAGIIFDFHNQLERPVLNTGGLKQMLNY